jgi:hypothetical protein
MLRMSNGFRIPRRFGLGSDRDRTGGAERVDEGMVVIDVNETTQYVASESPSGSSRDDHDEVLGSELRFPANSHERERLRGSWQRGPLPQP